MASFDVIRGFSVISMVLFHLCYDLRYLYGYPLGFFQPPLQDIWRASISWTFLFVAGCMCSFSRNNLRRAGRYLLAALAVYVVTLIASVDTPISFGIIFCMGVSTLLEALLERCNRAPGGWGVAVTLFVCFVLTLGVPRGTVGIGSLSFALPRWLYATPYFSFAGFIGPHFASGDYYPLIPYTLMYLAGSALGRSWHQDGYPTWLQRLACPALETVGRHALPIYLVHQPLIIGLLELLA
jgi:uncharacterized membrane protein